MDAYPGSERSGRKASVSLMTRGLVQTDLHASNPTYGRSQMPRVRKRLLLVDMGIRASIDASGGSQFRALNLVDVCGALSIFDDDGAKALPLFSRSSDVTLVKHTAIQLYLSSS